MQMKKPLIRGQNIGFSYDGESFLENLNFHINQGLITVFLGPSGVGKTTLFKIIAGLLKPNSGKIIVPDDFLFSCCFQEDRLLPWRNIEQNMAFVNGQNISAYLNMVDLSGSEKSFPNELSGGMRQRAALARSLAVNANIYLWDEPLKSVDPVLRTQIWQNLLQWQKKQKATVLLITHDIAEAKTLGKNFWFLNKTKNDISLIQYEDSLTDSQIENFLTK